MMARHYEELFTGIEHLELMNCTDLPSCAKDYRRPMNYMNFVYAEGLHLNLHKQLLEIETTIQKANEESSGAKGKLLIYTSERDRALYEKQFDCKTTSFLLYVPHDQIQGVYNNADILVHVEAFDSELIACTKYSISTKISEYMLSEKVILCYAPRNIAVYEYIESNDAGLFAPNFDEMQKAIRICLGDDPKLAKMGRNGRKVALVAHTTAAGRRILMNAIEKLLRV
jgi:glycosyltransferase involved in cell wall biosynthesis